MASGIVVTMSEPWDAVVKIKPQFSKAK